MAQGRASAISGRKLQSQASRRTTWMTVITCCDATARLGNRLACRRQGSHAKSGASSRPNVSYNSGVYCGGSSFHSFLPARLTDQLYDLRQLSDLSIYKHRMVMVPVTGTTMHATALAGSMTSGPPTFHAAMQLVNSIGAS